MPGVIVPKSDRLGEAIDRPIATPLLQPERNGLEFAARGASDLASDVQSIGLDLRANEIKARTTDRLNGAEAFWNSYLNGPEGPLQRRGENALANGDLPNAMDAGLQERQRIINDALEDTSGVERQALKDAWASRDRFAIDTLQRHQTREQLAFETATDEASVTINQQRFIGASSDAERDEAAASIMASVDSIAERMGFAGQPDQLEIARRKAMSPAIVSMLQQESQRSPANAQRLMEEYNELDLIDKSKIPALEKLFEGEGRAQLAQGLSAAAFAVLGEDATLKDYAKYIQDNSSGDLENEALATMERQFRINEASKTQVKNDSAEALAKGIRAMFATGNNVDPVQSEAARDELRRSAAALDLDESQTAGLMKLHSDLASGEKIESNMAFYDAIKRDPSQLDGLTAVDLMGVFEGEELDEALEMKRDRDSGELRDLPALTKEINLALDSVGLTGSDNAQKRGIIRQQIEADMRVAEADGPVAYPERQRIIDARTSNLGGGILGFGSKVTPIDDADAVDQAFSQNPNLVGVALFNASSGGARRATGTEITAQLNRLLARRRKLELEGDAEALARFDSQIDRNGEDARRRLHEKNYPDPSIVRGDELIRRDETLQEAAEFQARKKQEEEDAIRRLPRPPVHQPFSRSAGASVEQILRGER